MNGTSFTERSMPSGPWIASNTSAQSSALRRHRAELVHRPRERHRARARYAAERRTEARDAADRDGEVIEPFVSEPMLKATQPAGRRRAGAGGRAARARLRSPTDCACALLPAIALRERAERELGDENRAGVVEALHDRRRRSRTLIPYRGRRPTSSGSPSPRAGPSRPTECRAADRGYLPREISESSCLRLLPRALLGEVMTKCSLRVVALEPRRGTCR